MELLIEYFKYQLHAKTRHGIHSPFVYNFIEFHLNKPIDALIISEIEGIRNNLLKDKSSINFIDYGAGSRRKRKKTITVNSVAKHSLKSIKYAKLIAQYAKYIDAKSIIELGTSFGTTALYISRVQPNSKIITIEGCPDIAQIALSNFLQLGTKNIEPITGNFDIEYPILFEKNIKPDLIYIDGNHTYEATMRYFGIALHNLSSQGSIIFDDIYWSTGMKKAWTEIINHPSVSISMDFFYIGIITINPNFSKESFRIRY